MLRKSLGGFSLLIFVFAFAVPLLVLTNPAVGSDNYTFTQPYTKYYTCPDGTIAYTETGTTTNTATVDHPPDRVSYEYGCWPLYYDYEADKWIEECGNVEVSEHTSHGMTYVYNSNRVYYYYRARLTACR